MQDDLDVREFSASVGPVPFVPNVMRLYEDLPQMNALVRSVNTTLRRRLPTPCVYIVGGTYLETTVGQPHGPPRLAATPNFGLFEPNTSQPPHGNRHRHRVTESKLLRTGVETRQDRVTSQKANRMRYTERTLATLQDLHSLA
jgi:hypothetical protein